MRGMRGQQVQLYCDMSPQKDLVRPYVQWSRAMKVSESTELRRTFKAAFSWSRTRTAVLIALAALRGIQLLCCTGSSYSRNDSRFEMVLRNKMKNAQSVFLLFLFPLFPYLFYPIRSLFGSVRPRSHGESAASWSTCPTFPFPR